MNTENLKVINIIIGDSYYNQFLRRSDYAKRRLRF